MYGNEKHVHICGRSYSRSLVIICNGKTSGYWTNLWKYVWHCIQDCLMTNNRNINRVVGKNWTGIQTSGNGNTIYIYLHQRCIWGTPICPSQPILPTSTNPCITREGGTHGINRSYMETYIHCISKFSAKRLPVIDVTTHWSRKWC